MSDASPIFASTACLPGPQSVLERVQAYHAAGITHVELGANVTADHQAIDALVADEHPYLVHNYFPPPAQDFVLNLASADEDIRTRSLDLAQNALELCAKLKAPFYSVHAGFITDPTGFGTTSFVFPEPDTPQAAVAAFDRFVAALDTLLATADRCQVNLLVENNVCSQELKGKLLLQTTTEFQQLLATMPHPRLGLLVDTGHLNVSAHTLEFDRVEFICTLAPRIGAFHLHDNDGTADQHQPVTEGSWVLDALATATLDAPAYSTEAKCPSVEALADHVQWLQQACSPR